MQTIMENDCGEVLGEIIRKLAPLFEKRSLFRREVLASISEISARISASPPSADEFAVFCVEIHDWLVKFDSPLRAMLLRVLRLSISSAAHCISLVDEELHWIIVVCLERGEEYLVERMQALKLAKKFMTTAGDIFPVAFARSLVAISNHKDDNLRRVCIETLRELSVENPRVVATVNGFTTLLDIVLEPSSQDMAEPILMSLLFLLNDPKSRRFIRPYLDLRTVLSPFTDLDSEPSVLVAKWHCAKNAFVTIMRSWTGVIQLTSDELGLTTLVLMLRDTKVSPDAQGAILDAINEVFEPVVSQVKKVRGIHPSAHTKTSYPKAASIPTKGTSSTLNGFENLTTDSSVSGTHPRVRSCSFLGTESETEHAAKKVHLSTNSPPSNDHIEVRDTSLNSRNSLSVRSSHDSVDDRLNFLKKPVSGSSGSLSDSNLGLSVGMDNTKNNNSNYASNIKRSSNSHIEASLNLSESDISNILERNMSSVIENESYSGSSGHISNYSNSASSTSISQGKHGFFSLIGASLYPNRNNLLSPALKTRVQLNASARDASISSTSSTGYSSSMHDFVPESELSQTAIVGVSGNNPGKTTKLLGRHNSSSNLAYMVANALSIKDKDKYKEKDDDIEKEKETKESPIKPYKFSPSNPAVKSHNSTGSLQFYQAQLNSLSESNNTVSSINNSESAANPSTSGFSNRTNDSRSHGTNYGIGKNDFGGSMARPRTSSCTSGFGPPGTSCELSEDPDPLFNMLDNYAALLCCAFIHAKIVESLCYLGTHGEHSLAQKSRKLLVNILLVVAKIFPDRTCSELLAAPSLLELAANVTPKVNASNTKAHKASQILVSLADAFSVTPYETNSTYSAAHHENQLRLTLQRIRSNTGPGSVNNSIMSSRTAGAQGPSSVNPSSLNISSSNALSSSERGLNGGAATGQTKGVGANGGGAGNTVNAATITGASAGFFPSATIDNLRDLAEEMRAVSHSRLPPKCPANGQTDSFSPSTGGFSAVQSTPAAGTLAGSGGSVGAGKASILEELSIILAPVIDKAEFGRQMESSKVVRKENYKDPMRWDWGVISEMLDYSFQHSDRLSEAYKLKWVKRVAAFFKCSNEGQFVSLDWEPSNLLFLEAACSLYHLLVEDDNIKNNSFSELKSTIFHDMARELEIVIEGSKYGWNSAASKCSFKPSNCAGTMIREYFVLLGRVSSTTAGKRIVEEAHLFKTLSVIGNSRNLDYLSRLAVTSLGFTDGGHLSKQLIQLWGSPKGTLPGTLTVLGTGNSNNSSSDFVGVSNCSTELMCYMHTLLKGIFRSHPEEFIHWGVDAMITQLNTTTKNVPLGVSEGAKSGEERERERVMSSLLRLLEEVVQDKEYLLALVLKLSPLSLKHVLQSGRLAARIVALPEGIELLRHKDWLDPMLNKISLVPSNTTASTTDSPRRTILDAFGDAFDERNIQREKDEDVKEARKSGGLMYMTLIEDSLTKSLSVSYMRKIQTTVISPICMAVRDISSGLPPTARGHPQSVPSGYSPCALVGPCTTSTSINSVSSPHNQALQPSVGSECNSAESVDLEGLLRIPWNIEVKVSSQSTFSPSNSVGAFGNGVSRGTSSSMGGVGVYWQDTPGLSAPSQHTPSEYLKVDCFLDASELATPATHDIVCDVNRIVKIRGIITDAKGLPFGFPIAPNRIIANCLLAGTSPVHRDSRVHDLRTNTNGTARKRALNTAGPPNSSSRGDRAEPASLNSSMKGADSAPSNNMRNNLIRSTNSAGDSGVELAVTYQLDGIQDWSYCKPGHRQGKLVDLGDNRFAVEIPGEPVRWIFSRSPSPTTLAAPTARPAVDISATSSRKAVPLPSSNTPASSSSNMNSKGLGSYLTGGLGSRSKRSNSGPMEPLMTVSSDKIRVVTNGTSSTRDVIDTSPFLGPSNSSNGISFRSDSSRSGEGGYVFLVEVQYSLRLLTGQAVFVPMPRHMYGELARSQKGCEVLEQKKIIHQLLLAVKNERTASDIRRAALWGLGHISATEMGLCLVLLADISFIDWCISNVLNSPNYAMRATFFYVLGLVGRNPKGVRHLARLNWDAAPSGGNSAVAVPRDPSALFLTPFSPSPSVGKESLLSCQSSPHLSHSNSFNLGTLSRRESKGVSRQQSIRSGDLEYRVEDGEEYDHGLIQPTVPPMTLPLRPYLDSAVGGIELEILNLIAKLPGVIIFRECKARLDQIKSNHPEAFANRKLYATVHRMFEGYTFKLTTRRDILKLFLPVAATKTAKIDKKKIQLNVN